MVALGAVAVTLAAVLVLVVSETTADERRALDRRLQGTAKRAQLALERRARVRGTPLVSGTGEAGAGASRLPGVDQIVTAAGAGAVLFEGDRAVERLGVDLPGRPVRDPRARRIRTVTLGDDRYRALEVDVRGGRSSLARLQLVMPLAALEGRVADLRSRVALLGVLGLVLAGLGALVLARLALQRLEHLRRRAAALVPDGGARARLPRGGPREVDGLAATLNGLLDRVEEAAVERDAALEASRRFAADAGHELRTPMAAIGANLDTLRTLSDDESRVRSEIVAELATEHIRLQALLEGLQALASGEVSAGVPRERVDVADVVDAATQAAARRHPAAHFEAELPSGDAVVEGWSDGVRLAIDNLLDNAGRHAGQAPRVCVRVEPRGTSVHVTVEDDGPGIPDDERLQVLERFRRGSTARGSGSGLGLSIVTQQAALHGGCLTVSGSALGGTSASLELAREGPPSPRGAR